MPLREVHVEGVDFLAADVSGEKRRAVGSKTAPFPNEIAEVKGRVLQAEKSFRANGANLEATKPLVGSSLIEIKVRAIPRPAGKANNSVLPDRVRPLLILEVEKQ